MVTGPVFNQFGQLVGILSNNAIIGPTGVNVAFIRNGDIYSHSSEYLGRLQAARGNFIWMN